jgi:D-alanyl-D-alanine dipeptidase
VFGDISNNDITLIASPEILAVRIVENHEAMFDLIHQKEIAYGSSPEIPDNTDYTKMRTTVYEKLKQAQLLLPENKRFCLFEAYRSLSLQKMLFEARYKKIKNENPDWSHENIFIESTKLISSTINLDGSKNIPPHSTGGAIDVYLLHENGNTIDMGIHPKDWMLDDGSLSLTASQTISSEAQHNRKIMSAVLTEVGFVNYPTEYWHWSYGDRYWAYHKNAAHAIYSGLEN